MGGPESVRGEPLAGVQLILREGQSVDVLPGDVRTIVFYLLTAFRSGGQDGRKEVLNDVGQFVATLCFTDDSSGPFIASVHEPGTFAILGVFGLAWRVGRRSSRFRRLAYCGK